MTSLFRAIRSKIEYIASAIGLGFILVWVLSYRTEFAQDVPLNLLLVIGALVLLLGASEIVLEYSLKLAENSGVSEIVIGLTIVSIGTSIPEMFTAIASGLQGTGAFILGDIYGSYITQLTIFLGIVIILAPKTVNNTSVQHVFRDGFLVIFALCFLSFNISDGELTRAEAGISMAIYCTYGIYLFVESKRHTRIKQEILQFAQDMEFVQGMIPNGDLPVPHHLEKVPVRDSIQSNESPRRSRLKSLGYVGIILIGALLCYIGASFCVTGGVNLARGAQVPEHVVGATIVGFGTGFPEFVVSVMAIRKKRVEIAYGNLIGSNIVDPLLSISLGVMVNPFTLSASSLAGILGFLLPVAITVDVFIIMIFRRRKSSKTQGIIFGLLFLGFYAGFLAGSLLM